MIRQICSLTIKDIGFYSTSAGRSRNFQCQTYQWWLMHSTLFLCLCNINGHNGTSVTKLDLSHSHVLLWRCWLWNESEAFGFEPNVMMLDLTQSTQLSLKLSCFRWWHEQTGQSRRFEQAVWREKVPMLTESWKLCISASESRTVNSKRRELYLHLKFFSFQRCNRRHRPCQYFILRSWDGWSRICSELGVFCGLCVSFVCRIVFY